MTTVTFITPDRGPQAVVVSDGLSLMENARRANVRGIIAECGGACACATCHVHVAEDWLARVGLPNDMEREMLDFAEDVRPNSRLSCQITMTAALDGLVVSIPEET
jgi:2Fe-2S ferredoxin